MSSIDFEVKELTGYLELVDKKLRQAVPDKLSGLSRMLAVSGKRLRPSIVIATAYHSGKAIDDKVISAATAVELVHISSLVHDDIMDDGKLRWGVPTISSSEGLNPAILAGDYLLARACALAGSVSAECGILLAETIMNLCIGQAVEQNDAFNLERNVESLNSAISGKTSSLFIASCVLGGNVAGLNEAEIKKLTEFAQNFGVFFQYLDDISDFTGSMESTGKSVGNDIVEGNYTLPVISSLQGTNKQKLELLLQNSNPSTGEIYKLLQEDGSIKKSQEEVNKYKQLAISSLERLENQKLAAALKQLLQLS